MKTLAGLEARLLVDLLRDRVRPQKSLGQHYLLEEGAIERPISIASEQQSPLGESSHVFEVGPGPGSLTLSLLRTKARVTAMEVDEVAVEHLERVFGGRECNLEVILDDAVSSKWPSGITHVISNLPFQISSPIIERIRDYHSKNPIEAAILLVQEEFANRMAMSSLPYDIGPLGLNLWIDFDVSLDIKVPPSSFSPSPKVNSRIVSLLPRDRSEAEGLDKPMFRMITKHCFSNRRRKLRNLLSKNPPRISRISGWHKDRWKTAVSRVIESEIEGLEEGWPDLRPEMLEPSQWISLVREISLR
ncbi:MAG: 16S rRNA (adenine(1518)-N(6)/adenine(1519)-N(6))-dimethyltransferase RsmA [Candidatus Thermoplasmatota archaeon]|nr:16S rRNA (adenine(1518)-N(6)/adenine(1519)-N(6))-dimethyltransferase RsmA [Candidatus Thermoplasmatota archaeon]